MSTTMSDAPDTGGATIEGGAGAALVAAGAGALTLGVLTTLSEASVGVHDFLDFDADVGPLSGKTVIATIVYFLTLVVLGLVWRGRSFRLRSLVILSLVLIAVGLIGTFPEFFQAFA